MAIRQRAHEKHTDSQSCRAGSHQTMPRSVQLREYYRARGSRGAAGWPCLPAAVSRRRRRRCSPVTRLPPPPLLRSCRDASVAHHNPLRVVIRRQRIRVSRGRRQWFGDRWAVLGLAAAGRASGRLPATARWCSYGSKLRAFAQLTLLSYVQLDSDACSAGRMPPLTVMESAAAGAAV